MYNEYYGFIQTPFSLTPDPHFLYPSDKHQESLNHLGFGIEQRKGFIQLTGELGAGKTTLCREFLARTGQLYSTALILNPCLTDLQLIQSIVADFGLQSPRNDRFTLLKTLNQFLLKQAEQDQIAVLIIDEAQNLTLTLLEQVRLLSNLEPDQQKLLQIVLIGQPELRDKLDNPRLRQLRQHITVRHHLEPLTPDKMSGYIEQRLRIATDDGLENTRQLPKFSAPALNCLYQYSKGIPRLINAACDSALLAGYVAGTYECTPQLMDRAIRQLEGQAA